MAELLRIARLRLSSPGIAARIDSGTADERYASPPCHSAISQRDAVVHSFLQKQLGNLIRQKGPSPGISRRLS